MTVPEYLQKFFNSVNTQVISDCGQFLYAGNIYGDVFVVNLESITDTNSATASADAIDTPQQQALRPTQIFRSTHASPIYSLATANGHLYIGTSGRITAHRLRPADGHIQPVAVWQTVLTSSGHGHNEPIEVNDLWLDTVRSHLYAGCGDDAVYAVDLATQQTQREFRGHKQFVHCVTGDALQQRLFTGSEDGTVRMWDTRQPVATATLEPAANARLARRDEGAWIGAVAVNAGGDWLLCGGGPRLALWHLRSMECTTVYGQFEGAVHCTGFVDDVVLAAGESGAVHEYSLSGELVAQIPVSGPTVMSAVWRRRRGAEEEGSLLSLAGASNRLDVCSHLRYRDWCLELYAEDAEK